MREIKFRVWDEVKKQMVYLEKFNYPYMVGFSDETHKIYPYQFVELMQYTGLKDKNGKEIYEGDIIKFVGENCLVNYVENDCAFRIDVDSRISTALRKAHSKDYEVIGNIYENPELLKV